MGADLPRSLIAQLGTNDNSIAGSACALIARRNHRGGLRGNKVFMAYLPWFTYKDFINKTCQWVSVFNAIDILQCTRVHECLGYHWLSVNENLCLIYGFEKVGGWSLLRTGLRWNRKSPDLYPSYNPPPFHLYQSIWQIHAWRWVNVWRLKNVAGNIDNLQGIYIYKVRIDIHCWVEWQGSW